ncbi:MAG: hypothetical protein RLZZ179_574 [Verrucomicrobiota bacterium]|jgi:hypothetical protein
MPCRRGYLMIKKVIKPFLIALMHLQMKVYPSPTTPATGL